MRIADELLLLAYSDEGSAEIGQYQLDLGLGGALLLELALAERFDVRDAALGYGSIGDGVGGHGPPTPRSQASAGEGRIVVVDPSPLGDPVLDGALKHVAGDKKDRKVRDWVQKLSEKLRERLLDDLVATGVLTREKDRVLGIFARTRYPAAHGVVAPAEEDARYRLQAALDGPDPVPPRTAALAALVQSVGLSKNVFKGRSGKEVKKRIEAMTAASLADDRWASDGVRTAIQEVEAGVMVAIMAATTVTTTAAVNS